MPQTETKSVQDAPAQAYTYASILVHAEPGVLATRRVEAAAKLARRLGARLIGLGAEAMESVPAADPFGGYATAQWISAAQEQIGIDLKNAETAFRRDAAGVDLEWRSVQDYPDRALCRAARAADLIVVSPKRQAPGARAADPADVVMASGRPVLIVPDGDAVLDDVCVVVAWKDTREARRAVADAMPFLLRAKDVIIQAICDNADQEAARFQVEDVAAALRRHGVAARAAVAQATKDTVGNELLKIAGAANATLIVAGAYGHSRMAEWVFGGVTDDLMHAPATFVLMSH